MTRDQTNYIPLYSREVAGRKPFRHEVIADRKAKFASVLKYVTARHGWLTSIPGEVDVEMQCLPESSLPDELRAGAEFMLGDEKVRLPPYKLIADGETMRILPPHAGIVRVLRYAFTIP